MTRPNKKTQFLPLSEIEKYTDEKKWYCCAVVFSPETENDHFDGCPPYIEIRSNDEEVDSLFFQVPQIVAYYAKTHPCYTMKGIDNHRQQGARELAQKIKSLLEI